MSEEKGNIGSESSGGAVMEGNETGGIGDDCCEEEKDEAVEISMLHFAAGVSEYQEHVELENDDSAGNGGSENGGVDATCSGASSGKITF